MISPAAKDALCRYLSEQHCEENNLSTSDEAGPELLRYSGHSDFVGDSEGCSIISLLTLAPHKGRECWVAYMTGQLAGYTVAAVTHHASYGEHDDTSPDVESILWIGKGKIPEEVEKSLREYHAGQVVNDYAAQISVMNFSLKDIIHYVPENGRKAIASTLTQLLRTNLL